jgi:outer membrane receptor protein involved in Fe transport
MVSKKIIICFVLLTLLSAIVLAGTTGKLVGTVADKSNGEPLVGVNVVIAAPGMGAATDADGYFFINNVPPGNYSVEFSYVGYQAVEYQNISVTVDHTTEISLEMQPQAIEGEVVTVVAERPLILKDETSQRVVIQGEQIIDKLPVSTLQDVLSLQAGVTRDEDGSIHIRGGRLDEVAYLIDGTYVRNPFDNSLGGNVDAQAIQEMEVISGTFNAEYGNALSGVVNIVTKEGTPEFKFRMQYESPMLNQSPYHRQDWLLQTDVVKGLTAEEQEAYRDEVRDSTGESAYRRFRALEHPFTKNLKGISMLGRLNASISGPFPVFKDKIQFLLAGTFRNEESPLPYGFDLERVVSGKLTFKLSPTFKLQFGGDWSQFYYQDYNHQYKYWQFFEASDPQVGSFPVSEDLRTRFTGRGKYRSRSHGCYRSPNRGVNIQRLYHPGILRRGGGQFSRRRRSLLAENQIHHL